jgi:large subunit ribosomal protein L25
MSNARSKAVVLEVQPREQTGTNSCRRMRRQGLVPGNVYGLDRPPFKVAVNPRRIDDVLRLGSGVNTIFQLTLVGEQRTREAMIKELQRDPVSELPLHVDFIRVDPTKKIHVRVPVRLVGIPEGVKNEGAVLEFVQREVELECLPSEIPEHLDVDVSGLHVNQHVAVKDLRVAEGVRLLDDPEQILAVVATPRIEEAPAEVAAAAAEGAAAAPTEAGEGGPAAGEGERRPEKKRE